MTQITERNISENEDQTNADNKYKMTVNLNVLEHLGINLYSNIAAVLTEAVANAWDADAAKVEIKIDSEGKWVEIVDDGIGMNVDDMNNKYLRVGYRRRENVDSPGATTAKGRKVMGRKGLGKLSLFSIADQIDIQSSNGIERHGLRMTVKGIKESLDSNKPHYSPDALPEKEIDVKQGTKIVLREIKRKRLAYGATALRKRLARRFSVIENEHTFKILINDEPVTANDRGDLQIAQFFWKIGNFVPTKSSIPKVIEQDELPSGLVGWDANWKVDGWIGTARRPKQLDSKDAGNLNSIVVFARGRLFHENILDKLNDGRIYTKYLTGQIEANFLDDDDLDDIATSDRQRIREDDERYIALLSFLKYSLTQVEKRWSEWRRMHEGKEAQKTSSALRKWLGSLPEGYRKSAESLIGGLSALHVDKEHDRKLLFRHGIYAFERMRIRGSVEEFAENVHNIDTLLSILADRDSLEASLYRDIVKSRLDAIKKFQGLVKEDAREKVLQQYLFDHLWLLDPSWERATGSTTMESRLLREGVFVEEMSEREKLGRVDIAYRTNAGKHIIVELKKSGRKMKLLELMEQGHKYVDKLKKIRRSQGDRQPNIEVIFVIGKPIEEESTDPDRLKTAMASISPGSRIVHYESLIDGAQESYSEYLEKSKTLDKLDSLVENL